MTLPVCDHSQGVYFPPNRRRNMVFWGLFQQTKQTNKTKQNKTNKINKKLGKELNRIPNKYGHICSGFFLTPSPSSSPISVFPFFPILILRKMCATLCNNVVLSVWVVFQIPQEERRSLGSPRRSWGFPKKKLGFPFVHEPQNLEIALRKVGDLQDGCATVRRLGT